MAGINELKSLSLEMTGVPLTIKGAPVESIS